MRGMMRLAIMGVPGAQGGAAGPKNTVAPAIETNAVIGTEIVGDEGTWTPAPDSYAYQWQRYTSGAWSDIAGATNKNYTPVDADFGLALRLAVTATDANGSATTHSNSTLLVAEVPSQSLDAELVVNGDMETGDPPSNWTPGGTGAQTASVEDERPGGAGTKSLALIRGGTYNWPRATQLVSTTVGGVLYFSGWLRNVDLNTAYFSLRDAVIVSLPVTSSTAWTQRFCLLQCSGSSKAIWCEAWGTELGSARFDDVSGKMVSMNSQLAAPSADMLITQYYTLPATPVQGDALWLVFRAADFAAGNYWLAELLYTGAQWDIRLDSVASYVRTNRQAATNIGTTNGLRINASGASLVLETTANGGTSWTQRGGEELNSLYETATGVNTIATPGFGLGLLVFANPT